MDKKTKRDMVRAESASASSRLESDRAHFERREFLRSIFGVGATSLITNVPLLSVKSNSAESTLPPKPPVKPPQLYKRMVSPEIDDLRRPWCYLAHTTTLVGMPWMPDAVQVTYDGAIFTRHAELCFFSGDPLQPVLDRQKQWVEGWIPIVRYGWTNAGIGYEIEMFGSVLDGFDGENTLQFVRVQMRNTGREPAHASFAAASRASGDKWRFGDVHFLPTWAYEMANGGLYRDGALVYSFPTEAATLEAVAGKRYDGRFVGEEFSVAKQTAVGIARYAPLLAPGESMDLVFKMPRVPTRDPNYVHAVQAAEYGPYRKRAVEYWQGLLGRSTRLTVTGERLIEQAHRATAVHVILATRTMDGLPTQTDGLPYAANFLASIPEYGHVYDDFRLPDEFVRANVRACRSDLQPDGLFLDVSLVHGKTILTSQGQAMTYLLNHALRSQDTVYAHEIWPMIRQAVNFVRHDHERQPHGLMRPTWPYDAEMIQGQYTSHNLWCLNGLRAAIRVARLIGESNDAASWLKLHDSYQDSVLKALDVSAAPDGYIPTGLYKFITGDSARKGFGEWQTDQDFENMLLAWPGEALAPSDRRVAGTVDRLRDTKYREGIMTYRNCMHLHHYITVNSAMQDVVAGRDRKALLDTYHILLHCGSTFEGFETLVFPWTDRDTHPDLPPPHAWCAAKINNLLRNLFVLELGGRYGLDEGKRDLRLFNVISPAWVGPGERIAVENAPTEFGLISASMKFRTDGADVTFKAHFCDQPHDVVFRIPYFLELVEFKSDAKRMSRDGADVRISPDLTWLRLTWRKRSEVDGRTVQDLLLSYRREHKFWSGTRSQEPSAPKGFLTSEEEEIPPVPLSFIVVRDVWQREYGRRFAEFLKAGGEPVTVRAPELAG